MCPQQKKLMDWHDGRLSLEERLFMKMHLLACMSCQVELQQWRSLAQTFLQPLKVQESEVFVQQVMRKIRVAQPVEELARPAFFARWTFPALALSMASFAGALLYVAQPTVASAENFIQSSVSVESLTMIPTADQLLSAIVEKP